MLYPAELREPYDILPVFGPLSAYGWLRDSDLMATRRLSESQKQQLVESYRAGETSSRLADLFECSVNTVSRTLKSLLPVEEYASLKASRGRGGGRSKAVKENSDDLKESQNQPLLIHSQADQQVIDLEDQASGPLALDDAEDFADEVDVDLPLQEEVETSLEQPQHQDVFEELVPLNDVTFFDEEQEISCKPLSEEILPRSVYMLVDKVVELEARPLKDCQELGRLPQQEMDRKALYLYLSPRLAKRKCGRNQRVIKIPDTAVFKLSIPYLLARGITRLVIEGSLIAIDT